MIYTHSCILFHIKRVMKVFKKTINHSKNIFYANAQGDRLFLTTKSILRKFSRAKKVQN